MIIKKFIKEGEFGGIATRGKSRKVKFVTKSSVVRRTVFGADFIHKVLDLVECGAETRGVGIPQEKGVFQVGANQLRRCKGEEVRGNQSACKTVGKVGQRGREIW